MKGFVFYVNDVYQNNIKCVCNIRIIYTTLHLFSKIVLKTENFPKVFCFNYLKIITSSKKLTYQFEFELQFPILVPKY